MPVTLDICNAIYYLVIIPLNGRIYFVPCNLLTGLPFVNSYKGFVSLQLEDSCIANRNQDEILSIEDHCIEEYMSRTGTEDCVLVDHLINKIFHAASTDQQQSKSDNGLIQLFMDFAILQAIKNSSTHQDATEETLKSWICVFVTPIEWGKRVTSDALFSVFAGSRLVTPSNALVVPAFESLLSAYLHNESHAEYLTLFNSKNILCELSVGKTGDVSLSVDIFSIPRSKGPKAEESYLVIDAYQSKPTLFMNSQIQLMEGYKKLVALFRNAVKEKIGLSTLFCDELLNQLCSFICKLEGEYQQQGLKRFDQIYPFQASEFLPAITEQDISALRLITLMDIYAVLSPQWGLMIPEIQAIIEQELCITRVFFMVVPETPQLYPNPIEDVLFVSIILIKFKLESSSIKKFKYIYDVYKRFYSDNQMTHYTAIDGHTAKTVSGVNTIIINKLRDIYRESRPLPNLTCALDTKSNISTINYVYLLTNQVLMQSLIINAKESPSRLRAQKSEIMTLDRFLLMDPTESKFEETMLHFYLSESGISLLESMFPKVLHEFTKMYSDVKEEEPSLEDDAIDVSCLNIHNWYATLHERCKQLFRSEADQHDMYYTKIMKDLMRHQSEPDSSRIRVTQQKFIGTFMMVYFGYLKETIAKDFGQDSDSTRYILIFEQLMKSSIIGQIDSKLMKKALHHCGWVSETEQNKRKLMVYDIEDNFPVSECLQNEGIKMIPTNAFFAVVTLTRYYVKFCLFHALEDTLPVEKHYKAIKVADRTCPFDFYETICENIWYHVLESIYESNSLLECPSNVDIMDLELTLESHKSFKVAFTKYILNTFPLTYISRPDEKHRFPLDLEQDNCVVIMLTNRLVLDLGVKPAIVHLMDLTKVYTQTSGFVFYRPSNFDHEKNLSLPMLELIETELKKLLEIRFANRIGTNQRQFSSVHPHQCLKIVHGDTPFGYEALKTGVIRPIETDALALGFQYFNNDADASFVEVINEQLAVPNQTIQETDACIIVKLGDPYDNAKKHNHNTSRVGFKITDLENVCRVLFIKMNDSSLQRDVGDIVTIQDYDYTVLTALDPKDSFLQNELEKFLLYPYLDLYVYHYPSDYMNWIVLYSSALSLPLMMTTTFGPQRVAYFDSYEET